VPVWVGGMLETGVGRAANLAVAALPGMALAPDLDPRGRYDPDLAEPRRPVDGAVAVPDGPGTGAVPDAALLAAAEVVRVLVP
jgi:O-succinylbenzoate synthase